MTSSEVTIGASGLRSSWPSIARNSSLARFATSASCSASRDSPNRRTLSSASAARCASSPMSAPSSAPKRRPDSACSAHIAPIVRPRATSGTTQTARCRSLRTKSRKFGSANGSSVARLDVGEEGLAGRDRPRERAGRVGRRRRCGCTKRAHRGLARRIDVVGELSLQHAVLVEQVDAADVGDVGHDHRARSPPASSPPRASARAARRRRRAAAGAPAHARRVARASRSASSSSSRSASRCVRAGRRRRRAPPRPPRPRSRPASASRDRLAAAERRARRRAGARSAARCCARRSHAATPPRPSESRMPPP